MITTHSTASHPLSGLRQRPDRGSVLITAMIFSVIIGITLVGYLKLSTNSLNLAHRTFFADAANNLAEASTEEAVWAFNKMGNSTDPTIVATAWAGWNLGNTVCDVYMTSTGSGYMGAPTVTFSGGGGTGAAGTANVTTSYFTVGGFTTAVTSVSRITVTNAGSGYTSAPSVTLTGGGGTLATAQARLAATRTFAFPGMDQGASGSVKVWVNGYDGTAVVPIAVAQATITPADGPPIVKIVKIILSKTGLLPKGLIAKNGINWNGHPIANSYISGAVPGVPPFAPYDLSTARANITLGALYGPEIDLGSQGVVSGNVMLGPGVTVTGSGTVTGSTIGNLSYNFNMPTYPTAGAVSQSYSLGSSIPATLPRTGGTPDAPAADGKYYYFVNNASISGLTISAGKNVVLVDNDLGGVTRVSGRLTIQSTAAGVPCGSLKLYIDGPCSPGNNDINPSSWAGALEIYTTTTADCVISGNGSFYGCLFAPNAQLRGSGGGSDSQDLCGSFVVGSVTSNGHMSFHYDEALGAPVSPKAWSLALWTELQSETDRTLYAAQLSF